MNRETYRSIMIESLVPQGFSISKDNESVLTLTSTKGSITLHDSEELFVTADIDAHTSYIHKGFMSALMHLNRAELKTIQ